MNGKMINNRVLVYFNLLLILSTMTFAQEADVPSKNVKSMLKTNSFADEAIGVQTKGQLQNLTMNYGQISDVRYADVGNAPTDLFYNFRYPRENFTGLVDDFSLFFAIKENSKNGDQGNVIDAWTDNDNEDFIAKDGAYGKTHYNPTLDPTPHEELLYNGQTPYLAHSDLPDTWPVDENGDAFWPGIFRRDPLTGKEVEGDFASDRDIYIEFTDANNQQGDVVGIEVHEMAYNYGRIYAENILFYEFWIINNSGRDLTNCYTGFYQDPDCSDHGEETLLVKDTSFVDGTKLFSVANRDFDGDIGGATRPNSVGITEDYTFGTIVLETPNNLGVTDFHFFDDTGPTTDDILWPIITSDINSPKMMGISDRYFHGANVNKDDVSLALRADHVWIISTGPFDMAAGDTVKLTVAVAVGDNDADYYEKVWQAKELFDAKFNGPVAPASPTLRGVADDGKVTLYWDNAPEDDVDPSSGETDFEGYKIYRSEDGGITWGTKITDSRGRTYGYVPIAQFDLKNNIKGIDPKNSLIWLGEDNGLQHQFIDENLINGVEYSYTIVSYDRGASSIFSLEGTKGDGPNVQNFINITPNPKAMDVLPAELNSISQTLGVGEGTVEIEVINDYDLSEYNYKVVFEGTPANKYSVIRMDSENTEVFSSIAVNSGKTIIKDGFNISVVTDTKIGGIKSITNELDEDIEGLNNVQDSSWYVSASIFPNGDIESRSTSYSIRFSDDNSLAFSWGIGNSIAIFEAPFSVWDITNDRKVCFEVQDANNNSQWDKGEIIFITRVPYPDPAPEINSPNPASEIGQFACQVVINNAPAGDLNTPPALGSIININCYNPLTEKDEFVFNFNQAEKTTENTDLSKIKVVPNPYVVTSIYETKQNVREIKFMYLPSECKIYIYTLAGTLVKTLHHNSLEGTLSWNLISEWNQSLAYGVYLYIVEDNLGNRHSDKFALIK